MEKIFKKIGKGLGDPLVAVGLIGAAAPTLVAPVLGQVKAQVAPSIPYADLAVDSAALAGGAYLAATGKGLMRYAGAALILPPDLRLVAKLRDSAGTEIAETSRIVLAKSVAGKSPVPFAEYRYGRYRYLSETDQLDSTKREAVTQTLERPVVFDAGEELVIMFEADLVIDPSKSTLLVSAFEDVA